MSTLHRVAEAAVRRDLARAGGLLRRPDRLPTERRIALVDHLVWLTSLAEPGDPRVSVHASELRRQAGAFGTTGERLERDALITAVQRFLASVSVIERWTSDAAVCGLDEHLPWLLDGLTTHAGPGLLFRAQGSREAARLRAAEYRRSSTRLWGALVLA